jgi:orotate phosphoribosyltransferase
MHSVKTKRCSTLPLFAKGPKTRSTTLKKLAIKIKTQCSVKYIQGVQMKGIQNKIIISQKAFIIHIYGLHHYKWKLSKFFQSI